MIHTNNDGFKMVVENLQCAKLAFEYLSFESVICLLPNGTWEKVSNYKDARYTFREESLELLLEAIKGKCSDGEFKIEGNKITWYRELGEWNPETHEEQDVLYDYLHEAGSIVDDVLYNTSYDRFNTWQDNDSCGFDISLNSYESLENKL